MTGPNLRLAAIGAMLVATGIALGAFGAHALRAVLAPAQLEWWHTAGQYLLWNAIGLVALGALPRRLERPAWLIGLGTIVFCGSLYAMALSGQRWLGAVTPVGGALMIAGWGWAALRLWRR